ncbi:metal ABC transporter substrate-binding protein [Candidatus Enterococcus courvalinii]|uniref:Metal ABC transporter substrate-binding protein n=1 Tax=Candidatus Enterococcus courvalinii TaxID=2815329 RepID=A0ABS3I253_9ENTE|nr:metal ABC transporter substrate-binding protein [Enterococcus sp. MSG2901]MBO0481846.1 metal ABC transporter substrate-binding protein [Enterococcus sp. MSG2901]
MKKSKLLILLFTLGAFLVGCSTKSEKAEQTKDGKLTVVATNSILADMAKEVGKDKVTIHSIVPVGTDPHEYEVLPEDIKKASDAKVILYNGLNLETGNGWFNNLMETAKKIEDEDYFAVSREVEPLYLTSAGQETQADPHAWLDLSNGIKYVEEITRILGEKDPDNKETYEKNSQEYRQKLESLDQEAKESFATISEEKKLLVTSEGAFKYFSKAYQLPAAYIWEINTESQGTPDQMTAIIDQVKASKVPGLFVESSVDPRSMERVSKETGVPIAEKLFTDSVAKTGEEGDSYYGMMKWNIDAIHKGLSK